MVYWLPEYVRQRLDPIKQADAVVYVSNDYAIAVDKNGRQIASSSDHASVLQKVFDELENDSHKTGVRILLVPGGRPLVLKRSVHIPCENGGNWIIEGTASQNVTVPTIRFEGEGNVIENDNANEVYTTIVIEKLSFVLANKRANGLKLFSLFAARDVTVNYASWLGEPEVRNYGIAFRNGNAFVIENCRVFNTHAGFVSMMSEHGLLVALHFAAASWSEFGYLIPHEVGWAPLSALQDAGYPILGSSRHHVLIDTHFYGTGRKTTVTTPNGYTLIPTAFRVSGSVLIFPKLEGDIYRGFQNDWADSIIIAPYITLFTGQLQAGEFKVISSRMYPWTKNAYSIHAWLGDVLLGSIKGLVTPIVSGVVSVPAGGTYVIARFTVPTGRTLYIHTVAELYDPDGFVSAEIYNVSDGVTVATIDGFSDTGWSVPEGKQVEFRLVNSDTAAAHSANYAFLVSIW